MYEIKIILLSLIPAVIYIFFTYITTPYKSWDVKRAIAYFIGGSLSAPLVLAFHNFFPSWGTGYEMFDNVAFQVMFFSFIQIALLEEVCKYSMFYLLKMQILPVYKLGGKLPKTKKLLPKKIDKHPISIMIYAGAVSLGFAFIENISYGVRIGHEILYARAVFSMVIHMACGMMMGYWISLAEHKYKITTNPTDDIIGKSIFDVFMANQSGLRKFFYLFMGLFTAVFFHGLYDFNLLSVYRFVPSLAEGNIALTIQFLILTVAVILVKKMMDHLIKLDLKNKTIKQ